MRRSSRYSRLLLPAALLLAVALLPACQKDPDPAPEPQEIVMEPTSAVMSKAFTPYSDANIRTADLRIDAYLHGTTTAFLDGAKYQWREAISAWRFVVGGSNTITHYYWPIVGSVWNETVMTGRLDFAGYAPYDLSNTGVTLDSYQVGNPRFHASMPGFASYDSQKEFIYAYVDDQTKDSGSGTVPMTFNHPFASVYFALDVAPRGTYIKTITLENIYRDGQFNHTGSPQWSSHSNLGTYSVTGINKTVPNELNFGQTIGGPYFVMPQTLNHQTESAYDVKITVVWNDSGSTEHTASGVIGGAAVQWLPGTAYSYSLKIGDRSDDGILDITVTSWILEGTSTSTID